MPAIACRRVEDVNLEAIGVPRHLSGNRRNSQLSTGGKAAINGQDSAGNPPAVLAE
jgi:hypothetical protein